jgi:hypothetical protein
LACPRAAERCGVILACRSVVDMAVLSVFCMGGDWVMGV